METNTHFLYLVSTMAADDLATQGARSSGAVVLTHFSQDILISAPEGLNAVYQNVS